MSKKIKAFECSENNFNTIEKVMIKNNITFSAAVRKIIDEHLESEEIESLKKKAAFWEKKYTELAYNNGQVNL